MSKSKSKTITIVIAIIAAGLGYWIYQSALAPEEACQSMTLTEAKNIAINSECGDRLKDTCQCNEDTGTWWIDLDIEQEGCNPACVVNVVTEEAVINWRCMGVIPEGPQSSDNIGAKLIPELTEPDDPDEGVDSQVMYSDELSIASGQTWNKDTKLRFCVRYKSNVASQYYGSAILGGKSPLGNGYTFQIDLFEYGKDYYCGSWAIAAGKGRTYSIVVPLNGSSSNKDTFHEICIDDINSLLDNCVSEWRIDKNNAYLTDIYIATIVSPDEMSLDEYSIFDYYRVFVNGIQVPESVFPNQDFSKFSGTMDDDQPDDFVGWEGCDEAYAVSVEQ